MIKGQKSEVNHSCRARIPIFKTVRNDRMATIVSCKHVKANYKPMPSQEKGRNRKYPSKSLLMEERRFLIRCIGINSHIISIKKWRRWKWNIIIFFGLIRKLDIHMTITSKSFYRLSFNSSLKVLPYPESPFLQMRGISRISKHYPC